MRDVSFDCAISLANEAPKDCFQYLDEIRWGTPWQGTELDEGLQLLETETALLVLFYGLLGNVDPENLVAFIRHNL